MILTKPLALVLALTVAGACRSLDVRDPETLPWPEVQEEELGTMVNARLCGPLWFGGRPSVADIDLAVRRGVKTIVNAATPEECVEYDLEAVCSNFGLGMVNLSIESPGVQNAQVDLFLAQVESAEDGEVLLFCGNGSRSAMLFAIRRAAQVGVPVDEAIREARRAGMKPGPPERFIRQQVERLRQEHAYQQQDTEGDTG